MESFLSCYYFSYTICEVYGSIFAGMRPCTILMKDNMLIFWNFCICRIIYHMGAVVILVNSGLTKEIGNWKNFETLDEITTRMILAFSVKYSLRDLRFPADICINLAVLSIPKQPYPKYFNSSKKHVLSIFLIVIRCATAFCFLLSFLKSLGHVFFECTKSKLK